MNEEQKEVIVLGTIKSGVKSFDKIYKTSKINPDDLSHLHQKYVWRD